MKVSSAEPGVIVSGATHLALLLATLVVFSDAPKFEDAQESVPVEIITTEQMNQIMQGDKQAKAPAPTPVKADTKADVDVKKPTPPVVAKVDIPTPPPPLKRIPDPEDDDEDTPAPKPVPTQPRRVAAVNPEPPKPEPPRPEPPRPPVRPLEPPKAEPKPEPPKPRDAEAIEPPKPPVKPKVEPKKAEVTPPEPPKKVRPAPKEEAKPKPEEKPLDKAALANLLKDSKPEAKPLDKAALAKLLDLKKSEDKPASKPKSGDEASDQKPRFNSDAVSKILSKEPPGGKPSSSRAPSQTASLGSPTASAPKMSPSMDSELSAFVVAQFEECYTPPPSDAGGYEPQIEITFTVDGRLASPPRLRNPSSSPISRAYGEAADRAVRNPRCSPIRFPAKFAPYLPEWTKKSKFVRFEAKSR